MTEEYGACEHGPQACPRCLGPMPRGYGGAISRADNDTEVCSGCGQDEAIGTGPVPVASWPVEWAEITWEMARSERAYIVAVRRGEVVEASDSDAS